MSVTELITKHGVSITIQTAGTANDASGFPVLTYSDGSTVTGFIQPAGASELCKPVVMNW